MSEKRFEKSKSVITDYRIYDYEKEDAYFINCDDESTVDAIVELLNELSDENNILNKNEDDLKECTIENIKLKEENEQLRKYNELLIKQKEESIDRCQEIYRIVSPFRRE